MWKCNQSRPGFELVSPCPFPTTITIAPFKRFIGGIYICQRSIKNYILRNKYYSKCIHWYEYLWILKLYHTFEIYSTNVHTIHKNFDYKLLLGGKNLEYTLDLINDGDNLLGRKIRKLYIYIYIYHHDHVVPLARISLTLSRHFSLSFIASGRSSGLHTVSSHSCCIYVRAGRPAFAWPYAGVHRSTSLMSSSLLLQQSPACLVRLTCVVFVMGGRWPYSWCLVGCCRQDLFNIALNILV